MFALLLTAVMGAQPPALPGGSQQPIYEESVEVQAPSLTTLRRRGVVRGHDGALFSDVEPSWLSARLRGDAAAAPVTTHARKFEGPAALTILLDASGTMRGAEAEALRLVTEILLAIPSGDHVRLISFNRRFTSTAWLEADALRAAAVRRHLRHLASEKPARRPAKRATLSAAVVGAVAPRSLCGVLDSEIPEAAGVEARSRSSRRARASRSSRSSCSLWARSRSTSARLVS